MKRNKISALMAGLLCLGIYAGSSWGTVAFDAGHIDIKQFLPKAQEGAVAVVPMFVSDKTAGSGLCRSNAANPNFAQLCKLFDNQKDNCGMNRRTCDWISTSNTGLCRANAANPHFAQMCKLFDNQPDNCAMNRNTCNWIE